MYTGSQVSAVARSPNPKAEWFAESARKIGDVAPRRLFLIKHHRHREVGDLYGVYVSASRLTNNTYHELLYLGQTPKGLRIISKYAINRVTDKWEWAGGLRIPQPGPLAEVRKFEPPAVHAHRLDYDSY